jgi:hypothetical protein
MNLILMRSSAQLHREAQGQLYLSLRISRDTEVASVNKSKQTTEISRPTRPTLQPHVDFFKPRNWDMLSPNLSDPGLIPACSKGEYMWNEFIL